MQVQYIQIQIVYTTWFLNCIYLLYLGKAPNLCGHNLVRADFRRVRGTGK